MRSAAAALLLPCAASVFGAIPPPTTFPLSSPRLAVIGSSPARGIFDPSLLATGNAAFPFALAFSEVHATSNISTAVAAYDVAASAFVRVGAANAAEGPATFPCVGGAPCTANLIHEVPSLVADPADPDPARAVKVFSHSYLVLPGDALHYEIGFISLHSAPSLSGPFTAQPLLGWASSSPLSTAGVAQVLTDLPQLADCLAFSEPGAALTPAGALLLALTCISAPRAPEPEARIRVVLLSSDDHGASWRYAGLALDGSEAAALGNYSSPQVSAPAVFFAGGEPLLAVTPSAPLWAGFEGYAGCAILGLTADLAGVVRDAAGAPVVRAVIVPDGVAFNGACTAAPGNASALGDLYVSVLLPDGIFSIVRTDFRPS